MADNVLPMQVLALLSQIKLLTDENRKLLISQLAAPKIECRIQVIGSIHQIGEIQIYVTEPLKNEIVLRADIEYMKYEEYKVCDILERELSFSDDEIRMISMGGECQVLTYGGRGFVLGNAATLDLLSKMRKAVIEAKDTFTFDRDGVIAHINKFEKLFMQVR
jgi:hypothetical protein